MAIFGYLVGVLPTQTLELVKYVTLDIERLATKFFKSKIGNKIFVP
jgi:hypothetical protein